MKNIVKLSIASLAALSLLAGCGNKDNPDPGPDPGPTPVDVVKVESVTLDKTGEFDLDINASVFLRATIAPENASNKNLKWSSSDDSIAIVAANGKVVGLSVGKATITVESEENAEKKVSVVVNVVKKDTTVHVTSVAVSPKEIKLDLGGTVTAQPEVTVLPENATNKNVIWSSSDPAKVVVDSLTGAITAIAKTETPVTITAKSADIQTITDTLTVSVADTRDHDIHVDTVTIEDMKVDLNKGGEGQLVAVVTPANAGNKKIIFSSSDETTVTVTSISETVATVKGHKTGTATITATSEDGGKTDTCVVTVEDSTVLVTGMSIKANDSEVGTDPISVELQKTLSLTAAVLPDNASNKNLTWSIVSEKGGDYVNLSSDTETTISVYAKKLTTEPVVVRATSVADNTKYKDVKINVIDPTDVDRWVNFVEPANYTLYKSRIDAKNLNDTAEVYNKPNLSAKFFKYAEADQEKYTYRVGDQGVFEFAPSAYVKLARQSEQTEIKNVATTKKLYVFESGEYTEVQLSDYFTVTDNSKYVAKVNDQGVGLGVGKKFKLVLTPGSDYYTKDPDDIVLEFNLVHAYNVYTLAQLSLFDNYQTEWNSYKIASGLGGVSANGGLILHNDIKFTSDILPSEFVYTKAEVEDYISKNTEDFNNWAHVAYPNDNVEVERANAKEAFINSPKDLRGIFTRSTAYEDFEFSGNFFSIDASNCKKIALMAGKEDPQTLMNGWMGDGSHLELFMINDEYLSGSERDSKFPGFGTHNVYMKNFSIKGNGSMADGGVSKGGLIAIKVSACHLFLENVISTQAFTTLITSDIVLAEKRTNVSLDRVYSYDCYSSSFYFWGTEKNTITNSWLSKCGGPLVIIDEHETGGVLYSPDVTCTNCYLFNEVAGTESWFAGHTGAGPLVVDNIVTPGLIPASEEEQTTKWYGAYAAGMKAAGVTDARTIARGVSATENYCNFIAIDVMASNFAGNVEYQLKGKFTINNGSEALAVDMADTEKTPYGTTAFAPTDVCPLIYKSSAGGVGYVSANTGSPVPTFNDPAAFCGNFTTIYMDPVLAGSGSTAGKLISAVLGTYAF